MWPEARALAFRLISQHTTYQTTASPKRERDNRGDKKKQRNWEKENGKQGNYTDQKSKTKRGECDFTDEALALLNHLKPLMNL